MASFTNIAYIYRGSQLVETELTYTWRLNAGTEDAEIA
jgi:hypothetical protein